MATPKASLILVMPPQTGLLNGFASGLISVANFVGGHVANLSIQLLDLSSTPVDSLDLVVLKSGIAFAEDTVVGITTTTASYQSALAVAAAFKKITTRGVRIWTVLGGHHASAEAETVLRTHSETVDYVVIGEGEIAMTEFVRSLPNVCSTPGLAFLHKHSFHANPPAPPLAEQELDSIPLTFKSNGLKGTPGKFDHVTYVSARGCPLKCAFCSVANQRIRARSVGQVRKDIRQLVELGFSRIAIEDNFFAHTPRRTDELCEALASLREEGLRFGWDCQTRVESMDRDELVARMERAGCEAVYLGVESLNTDQLRYLNKAPNPAGYLARLREKVLPPLLASNVDCYINLQFGLPGETDAHHEETRTILREMGLAAAKRNKRITIFPQLHVVYPGTQHFHDGVKSGVFPRDIFEAFTAWEVKQTPVLRWLGKHFAHGTGGIPLGIIDARVLQSGRFEMPAQEIVDFNAILRIASFLTDLDDLNGIHVFKYSKYLVRDHTS